MMPCKPFVPALIGLALWLALPAPSVSAQENPGVNQPAGAQPVDGPPLRSADDLTTSFYRPGHVDLIELANLAREFHGRDIYVVERGGLRAHPLRNLQTLGDSLLIYDEPEAVERIQAWCRLVDQPREGSTPAGPAELVVAEWRPGFVSLETAYRALEPFQRGVDPSPERTRNASRPGMVQQPVLVRNISRVDAQGVLILRDSADQVQQMLDVLDELDKPDTQLLLTTMVLRGSSDPAPSGSPPVPAELSAGLSQLVPYDHFVVEDMGILRTATRGREIGVRMAQGNHLILSAEAFDAASSTLTASFEFRSDDGFALETRTALGTGEYTVLGATGAEPRFVVLRLSRLD